MEEIAKKITITASHTVEIVAACIIGLALIRVLYHSISNLFPWVSKCSTKEIRVTFGSSVAVALELMLGADVLATAVTPGWNEIGQLAAIAVLRTALNYFLGKELKEIIGKKIR